MLYAICKPLAVLIMKLLFRLEARGTEHVPAHGPLLIVSNHSSVLDPPLVGGMTPRRLTFLAKAELFRIPGFGWLIRRLGAQPLRRDGADPSALRRPSACCRAAAPCWCSRKARAARRASCGRPSPAPRCWRCRPECPSSPCTCGVADGPGRAGGDFPGLLRWW